MAKKSRGTGWLVFAILFGLISIPAVCFGMYAIWHTNNNVQIHRDIVVRKKQELINLQPVLHLPGNNAKAEELRRMIEMDSLRVYEYESTRYMAFLIAGSSAIPIFISIVLFVVFLVKRSRSAAFDPRQKRYR